MANKQEVKNLKYLLKQTENLVQDLHEELEMKDSLTVKELATEDFESQDVHNDRCFDDTVHVLPIEHNLIEENCDENAEVKSISIIEAELEAELQRLESNMISSSLKGKLSNLAEVSILVCACFCFWLEWLNSPLDEFLVLKYSPGRYGASWKLVIYDLYYWYEQYHYKLDA